MKDVDPIVVPPPSDDEAICFTMSDSPTSLANAILCRITGPSMTGNSASTDGGVTWTTGSTSPECPLVSGSMFWQYDADVTRWVTFLKVPAEDCSLNLLQGMQPQIAFVVVQDCLTTVPIYSTEDNFTDLDIDWG